MSRGALAAVALLAFAACEPATPQRPPEQPSASKASVRVSGTARAGISVSLRNAVDPRPGWSYDPLR